MKQKTNQILFVVLLALGLAGLTGCQLPGEPGSQSHASVRITGHTDAEIQKTANAVFAEDGYGAAGVMPGMLIYDRPGSRRDALKWGGLAGSGVTMRVKVQVTSYIGSHLLQADAYSVQNSDDAFFQNENRLMTLNHRPYQKLLNEIAKRLK